MSLIDKNQELLLEYLRRLKRLLKVDSFKLVDEEVLAKIEAFIKGKTIFKQIEK